MQSARLMGAGSASCRRDQESAQEGEQRQGRQGCREDQDPEEVIISSPLAQE